MTTRAAFLAVATRIETEEPSSDLVHAMARALGYVETPRGWHFGLAGPVHRLPPWLDSLDASTSLMHAGGLDHRAHHLVA